MPWCDRCDEYRAPTALTEDGNCAACGSPVDTADTGTAATPAKVPWHFWLMVIALVGYLGWRLVEAVVWLVGRL